MHVVPIGQLKDHLSEYVRRAQAGERLLITSRGEIVAELRSPEPEATADVPLGLLELVQRGAARAPVRNDPSLYRIYEPALATTTARDLLDWSRGGR